MFNSTSNMYTINIDITWDEPVFPNGIITSYEVNVTRTDDLNDVVYSDNSLPVPDVTESVMVLPFTNYTVTVAASTSAGQGEAFSIPIESPEAGKVFGIPSHYVRVNAGYFMSLSISPQLHQLLAMSQLCLPHPPV